MPSTTSYALPPRTAAATSATTTGIGTTATATATAAAAAASATASATAAATAAASAGFERHARVQQHEPVAKQQRSALPRPIWPAPRYIRTATVRHEAVVIAIHTHDQATAPA